MTPRKKTMSRFYQKYLSGLKKDDKSGVGKKIDPTSMAPSARISSNSGGKGKCAVIHLAYFGILSGTTLERSIGHVLASFKHATNFFNIFYWP